MLLPYLPSVLQTANPANSLSMERALKQIQDLLCMADLPKSQEDRRNASLDDLDTMIAAINRS